jgi:hypothetical protein
MKRNVAAIFTNPLPERLELLRIARSDNVAAVATPHLVDCPDD